MIPGLPSYVSIVFGLTMVLTLYLLLKAAHFSKYAILVLSIWTGIQVFFSLNGFYKVIDTIPPRFVLLIIPPILLIIILFNTQKGKLFIDSLDIKVLTIIHTIRILVEIILFWLFMYKTIPVELTFEGRNFDIISGVTAPIVYYFGFIKQTLSKKLIISWNIISIGLLLNVVLNSILSSPLLFQKFEFNQPNIAVLNFPFVFLPSLIVPIILFSHFVIIRKLKKK
jgi:hypothetical protein